MIAVDVGNTKTAVGLFRETELLRKWKVATDPRETCDQHRLRLDQLLATAGESLRSAGSLILSSVVPEATGEWAKLRGDLDLHIVTHKTPATFEIALADPSELGADRIADAEAAVRRFGVPVIIIDAGTAITLSAVNARRQFVGGTILPGIGISLKALFAAAARLSQVDLTPPERAIGNSTRAALQSGAHFGYSSMINGLVDHFRRELGEPVPTVIATGGSMKMLGGYLKPEIRIEEDLTLHGLSYLHENLTGPKHA